MAQPRRPKSTAPLPELDRFAYLQDMTRQHRASHGCGASPYANGPLLGVIARACDARRILECGTALGYTAITFAAAVSSAEIDTIERDPAHVKLARDNIVALGMESRVALHEGDFRAVMATLKPGYDLAFFDGHTPDPALLSDIRGLLRVGGTLIAANLNHGGTADAVRAALANRAEWATALIADGETGISIRL